MTSHNSALHGSTTLERLLPVLACPICKNPVSYNVTTAMLVCSACQQSYPVDGGIPVLFPKSPVLKA